MSTSPSQILSIYTVNSSMDDSNCLIEEENAFCTEDNVEECTEYLSQVGLIQVASDKTSVPFVPV